MARTKQHCTDLSEEHVLGVVLALRHLVAKLLDLGVLGGVGVDLVAQLLVLVEQALGVGQTVGDVLGGDGGLRAGQPLLEVVQAAQEALQLARLAQLLVALLQL